MNFYFEKERGGALCLIIIIFATLYLFFVVHLLDTSTSSFVPINKKNIYSKFRKMIKT